MHDSVFAAFAQPIYAISAYRFIPCRPFHRALAFAIMSNTRRLSRLYHTFSTLLPKLLYNLLEALATPSTIQWLESPITITVLLDRARSDDQHVAFSLYTLRGLMFQIASAYCLIVRSEEKTPLPAVLMIDIFAHRSWSR
jgi:hypothetical protein